VDVVDVWTGRRASALRAALRLTNEAFATYLGASVRTVAYWESRPDTVLSPSMQEALDTAFSRASEDARQRFAIFSQDTSLNDPFSTKEAEEAGAGSGESSGPPAPDEVIQASQAGWRKVRRHFINSGWQIARRIAELYEPQYRIAEVPALAQPHWLPSPPISLDKVKLHWNPDPPAPRLTGREAETAATLPLRAPGHAFASYTGAIRYVSPPAIFENRHSYRMLDLDWSGNSVEMTFGLSTFFDKLDVAEPLTHEAAQADLKNALDWPSLPYRTLLRDPFDLRNRPVNPGIATLTIRRDTKTGEGTFFLLRRDPTQVTNGRHYSLLPSGEFQPASISPASVDQDLDLWRNVVREYSEEMLGQPEHDGSAGAPVDYAIWPFYRDITRARDNGQVRPYLLGVILDALSLNAVIATAVVTDDDVFDRLFREMVRQRRR
jgi:transcriptional regulator with XRE-family HTH domain